MNRRSGSSSNCSWAGSCYLTCGWLRGRRLSWWPHQLPGHLPGHGRPGVWHRRSRRRFCRLPLCPPDWCAAQTAQGCEPTCVALRCSALPARCIQRMLPGCVYAWLGSMQQARAASIASAAALVSHGCLNLLVQCCWRMPMLTAVICVPGEVKEFGFKEIDTSQFSAAASSATAAGHSEEVYMPGLHSSAPALAQQVGTALPRTYVQDLSLFCHCIVIRRAGL